MHSPYHLSLTLFVSPFIHLFSQFVAWWSHTPKDKGGQYIVYWLVYNWCRSPGLLVGQCVCSTHLVWTKCVPHIQRRVTSATWRSGFLRVRPCAVRKGVIFIASLLSSFFPSAYHWTYVGNNHFAWLCKRFSFKRLQVSYIIATSLICSSIFLQKQKSQL